MTSLHPLPETYASTRDALQRVATHVLARRRFALSGKFGLRATPGGFGTPACGPEHEVVRVAGTHLARERTGDTNTTAALDLRSATLAEAAALVEVDLDAPFEAGHDTPPVGDVTAPLAVDPDAAAVLAEWYRLGWGAIDAAVVGLGADATPSVLQLWPEHFDAGVDVAAAPGRRVNLGASPGDGFSAQPYLYVGPWDADRPGDSSYWNAPFGAVLAYDELRADRASAEAAVAFLLRGVGLLGSGF
ncbi:MAG: hypothetical protein JNK12_04835 [Acidimicrobiales bacterium]|nr:hypothetical protein [Acidimicrobiales bacterium]